MFDCLVAPVIINPPVDSASMCLISINSFVAMVLTHIVSPLTSNFTIRRAALLVLKESVFPIAKNSPLSVLIILLNCLQTI